MYDTGIASRTQQLLGLFPDTSHISLIPITNSYVVISSLHIDLWLSDLDDTGYKHPEWFSLTLFLLLT